jgi:hypothetical protein
VGFKSCSFKFILYRYGVVLDTAAAGSVEEAAEATRFGRPLRPANERAAAWTRRLPFAAAFAAAAASIAMNPAAVAPLASVVAPAVRLYTLNAVKTHSLKAPGFNPWT